MQKLVFADGNNLPIIPGRSELLGKIDSTCPLCLTDDVWAFKHIDTEKFYIICNHCGFGMMYGNIDVLMRYWAILE